MNELLERYDETVAAMEAIMRAAAIDGDRELTDAEQARYSRLDVESRKLVAQIDANKSESRSAAVPSGAVAAATGAITGPGEPGTEQRHAAGSLHVKHRTHYGEESRHSWVSDIARRGSDPEAARRVQEERSATQQWLEQRNLVSTSDSDGGYFTAPAVLQSEFVELRKSMAVALGLVTVKPIPAGTTLIKLPKATGATAVAATTQGSALQDTDMVLAQAQAQVYRVGGKQVVSNFLIDNGMPGLDSIVLNDLAGEVYEQADTWLLHGTGSSQPYGITKRAEDASKTVTADAATATMSDVYPKVMKAIGNVAEGNKRYPTGILAAPRRLTWMQGQLDSEKRPLAGGFGAANALTPGFAGAAEGLRTNIGNVPVYVDGNMRTNRGTGTDEDDIIVGCLEDVFAFTSVLRLLASTEARFSEDDTVFKATMDMAVMADRRPDAVYVVQGTALNDVL